MKMKIKNAINIIENSLTGTRLELRDLGLTAEDLIYIFSIEKYKSFFENLTILDLSYNEIKELSNGIFNGLEKLTILDLHSNQIEEIQNGVFSGLENLEGIYLSFNEIKKLSNSMFSELENFRYFRWVDLRDNYGLLVK